MHPSEYIADIRFSMAYVMPECVLLIMFILLIIVGISFKTRSGILIPTLFFIGICIELYYLLQQYRFNTKIMLFSGALSLNARVIYLKVLFAVCGLLTVFFKQLSNKREKPAEFYSLVTAIIFGANLMVLASNFLIAFLGLEIISVASYILVALPNEKRSAEASVKYLLYGMFASAIMLYGISLLFGFTGSVDFLTPDFSQKLAQVAPEAVTLAFIMVMAGVLFKISVFPFHFWVADVYESTPMATVAFFSTCSKLAGFGFLLNFLPIIWQYDFKSYVEWFSPEYLIGFCAVTSIGVGNLMALTQKNAKRMLAYSAIAHSGFILLPLTSFENQAHESVLYYMAAYVFISFASFFAIDKIIKVAGNEEIESFSGLGISFPALGIAAIICMIALTGLPPTTGFFAKFYIFSAIWDSYTLEQERIFLYIFLFGLSNTVLGLFYYLKIPYFMFLKRGNEVSKSILSTAEYFYLVFLTVSVLLFFFLPDWLKM